MNVSKKSIVPVVCISVIVGICLLGAVGYMSHSAYKTIVTDATIKIATVQDEYAESYGIALVSAQDNENEVIGVVLGDEMITVSFYDYLEAAGFDTERIIVDSDGTYVYLIAPGDTLTSISAAFGYSVDELANYNQIRNVNMIYANSALRIPS